MSCKRQFYKLKNYDLIKEFIIELGFYKMCRDIQFFLSYFNVILSYMKIV